jgi:hypothetical protein
MNVPKLPISPGVPKVNRPNRANVNETITTRHLQGKPRKLRNGAGGLSAKNNGDELVTSRPSPYHIYHPAA